MRIGEFIMRRDKNRSLVGSEHSRISLKSKLGSELTGERNGNFDEGRIIEHYRRLKESQHHTLSTLNLSEELKRRLFGFS
jgi:hypothetical protein